MKYLRQIDGSDQTALYSNYSLPNVTLLKVDGEHILYLPYGYTTVIMQTMENEQIGTDANVITVNVNGEKLTFEHKLVEQDGKTRHYYVSRFLSDQTDITLSDLKISETIDGVSVLYFGHEYIMSDGSSYRSYLIPDTDSFDAVFSGIGITSDEAKAAMNDSSSENHDKVSSFCKEKKIILAGRNWWFGGTNEVRYHNILPLLKAVSFEDLRNFYDAYGIDYNDNIFNIYVQAWTD